MCDLYQLYANEEFLIGALLVQRSQMLLMRALPHTSAIVLIVLQVAHSWLQLAWVDVVNLNDRMFFKPALCVFFGVGEKVETY